MAKSSFQGLSLIRKDNQKKVISILKAGGSCSCAQLNKTLPFSSVALYNVMDDLVKKNIVKSVADNKSNVGRKPSLYALNERFGLFAGVDYSSPRIKIDIFDIYGNSLISEQTDERFYLSIDDVKYSIDRLSSLLESKNLCDLQIKAVCICTPGRIDKETGYFWKAAKFIDCTKINLFNMFREKFDCPIVVKNDMHIALIGHKNIEPLNTTNSALYYHISESAGATLYINGEIFEGENGYAGEFGSVTDYDDTPLITEISLGSMIRRYLNLSSSPENNKLIDQSRDEFIQKFLADDENVVKTVDQAAKMLAVSISNIVVMLDITTVIINGNLSLLGDKYLERLNKYLNQNEFSKKTRCYFSPLKEKANYYGLVETAIQTGIYAALDE